MRSYFLVDIRNLPSELEELASSICFEQGCSGVSQNLQFQQPDLVYEAQEVHQPRIHLQAFFEKDPGIAVLRALQQLDSSIEVMASEKPQQDWMEEWKKHFKAFPLVGPYWVVPSWLQAPAEAKKILRIDPGMAFGTGTHATTQIASELILKLGCKGRSALDVGTGTGVLAMLLAHEGCRQVDATEIDPMARETAVENLRLNHLTSVCVHESQIESLTSDYDIVVANIIDGILIRLREDLLRLCKVGGQILVTGILDERKNDFLVRFNFDGKLELIGERSKDEWWGYLFRRKS